MFWQERERERGGSRGGRNGFYLGRSGLTLHNFEFDLDDWHVIIRIDFCSVNR